MKIISVVVAHPEYTLSTPVNDVHIWQVTPTEATMYLDRCQQGLSRKKIKERYVFVAHRTERVSSSAAGWFDTTVYAVSSIK